MAQFRFGFSAARGGGVAGNQSRGREIVMEATASIEPCARRNRAEHARRPIPSLAGGDAWGCVSAIKPFEGFGDVDHTIKELMSL
jgi:hypothetical protein